MYLSSKVFRPVCCFIPIVYAEISYDYPDDRRLQDEKPVSGMEALYNMFGRDKYGTFSKELVSVFQISFGSACLGFIYGGIRDSRGAALEYIQRNDTTMYISQYEAKRKAQDYVFAKFMINGFKWGFKLAAFSFLWSLTYTAINVYRGNVHISDFTISGIICGAAAKCYLGLKGAVSGAVVGCFTATVFGSIIVGLMKWQGKSMDELREWQLEMRVKRELNLQGRSGNTNSTDDSPTVFGFEQLRLREAELFSRKLLDKEVAYIRVIESADESEKNVIATDENIPVETNEAEQIIAQDNVTTGNTLKEK